jgi:hypothetical protein
MKNSIHIWPQEPEKNVQSLTISAIIEIPGEGEKTLWYKIPAQFQPVIPESCDHFVVGSLFLLMKKGLDVRVHGQVSPSLLRNLFEFQSVWCHKRADLVNVSIFADIEQEDIMPPSGGLSIMAFSGGVDSCFTALRHSQSTDFRFPRKVVAGLMIQGFDIPLEDNTGFELASVRSRKILSDLKIELLTASTNYRDVIGDWDHSHGAAIASCLYLFRKKYSEGIIGQTFTYDNIGTATEGVNPLTDPLLSSKTFTIVPDGAAFTRADKILSISRMPRMIENIRVCWEGQQRDQNCCNCEKCMRNILTFRALGLGLPSCFNRDISLKQIKTLRMGDRIRRNIRYEALLPIAKAKGTEGKWTDVMKKRLRTERRLENSKIFRKYYRNKRRAIKILSWLKNKSPF